MAMSIELKEFDRLGIAQYMQTLLATIQYNIVNHNTGNRRKICQLN
jgi:hypothetical protein